MAGEGLISNIQDTVDKIPIINRFSLKPRNTASPAVRKFMEDNKGVNIRSIRVGRKPIVGGIEKMLNVLSFGNFGKVKKRLKYDDVLHSYILVELENGKVVKIEKNATVEIKDVSRDDYKNELHDIPVNKSIDIQTMLGNSSRGDKDFYLYSARNNNCQIFVKEIVERNGLTPTDKDGQEAIDPQNSEALINSLGKLKGLPQHVTDLAGGLDRAIYGNGLHKKMISVDDLFKAINQ